jgi:hypothetical protein
VVEITKATSNEIKARRLEWQVKHLKNILLTCKAANENKVIKALRNRREAIRWLRANPKIRIGMEDLEEIFQISYYTYQRTRC